MDDSLFHLTRGIPDPDTQGEAVELVLRKEVCALELEWILGRDDQERLFEPHGPPVYADLGLVHRFEQGGLGPWRGPVDLVGQDDVGEDRAPLELEVARLHVVDAHADNIRGEQVRRELDAVE